MLQDQLQFGKWSLSVFAASFFLSVAAFIATDFYPLLLLPLLALFIILMKENWKAAYWVLLFTLPLSVHVYIDNQTLSITLPSQPIMWLFLLLSIFLFASNPASVPKWWLFNPVVLIVLLQFIWLIVASAYSKVPLLSFKFLLSKTWFLASFFLLPLWIFKKKEDFKKGFLLMLIPIAFTMLIIMIRHASVDFRFKDIELAVGKVYYNHVEYSSVISMFFPLVYLAFSMTKGKMKKILFLLLLFFIVATFFAFARAAFVAIAFAFIVGWFIKKKWVNILMPGIYGLLALTVVYLAQEKRFLELRPEYQKTYMRTQFADHMLATFKGRDVSSMERLYRWIAAIRMSEESPLTGFGPHAFYHYYKQYALADFATYSSENPEKSTTHNYLLHQLAEQGYPAMLLYALIYIVAFAMAQRTYHRFEDIFYKKCTLGLAMVLTAGFINNFFSELIETPKVGALFYLSLSLLIILHQKSIKGKLEKP